MPQVTAAAMENCRSYACINGNEEIYDSWIEIFCRINGKLDLFTDMTHYGCSEKYELAPSQLEVSRRKRDKESSSRSSALLNQKVRLSSYGGSCRSVAA